MKNNSNAIIISTIIFAIITFCYDYFFEEVSLEKVLIKTAIASVVFLFVIWIIFKNANKK